MILLRKLRQEKGMSYKQLEKATGVGEITIRNIEAKNYKTSKERLKKLADYFGIKEPLELTKNVSEIIKVKSCLNQICLLNNKKYCQSEQVCDGAYCKNENEISNPAKSVKFNNTNILFAK
jgi:Predicted transcription factor, homolog of eukaryotic MBF1